MMDDKMATDVWSYPKINKSNPIMITLQAPDGQEICIDTTKLKYKPAFGNESGFYPEAVTGVVKSGTNIGYYSKTLYPHMFMDNENLCWYLCYIMSKAYIDGVSTTQQKMKTVLGL